MKILWGIYCPGDGTDTVPPRVYAASENKHEVILKVAEANKNCLECDKHQVVRVDYYG